MLPEGLNLCRSINTESVLRILVGCRLGTYSIIHTGELIIDLGIECTDTEEVPLVAIGSG